MQGLLTSVASPSKVNMSILTKNSVSCNVFEPIRREKATPSQEVTPVPVLIKNNKINRPKNTQCNYTDTVAKNCGVNDERNQRSEGTGIPPEFEGSEGSGRARSSWREASKARDNGAVDDGRQGRDADANSPINLARPGEARDCWDEAIFSRRSGLEDVHLSSRRVAAGGDHDSRRAKNDSDRRRSSNTRRDESRGQEAPKEAKGQLLIQYEWVLLARHCQATGDTKDAVYARRKTRTWTEGVQSKRVGKKIYVNPVEYNAWVKKSK